jgi:hypothetical protein
MLYPAELCVHLFLNFMAKFLSGWQDSNLRPPAPKAGAITGLRYTPKAKLSGETGTRTLATVTRRQISNLLHYRSGTSPCSRNCFLFCECKCKATFHISQLFSCFFLSFFKLFFKTLHNQTNRKNKIFINFKNLLVSTQNLNLFK